MLTLTDATSSHERLALADPAPAEVALAGHRAQEPRRGRGNEVLAGQAGDAGIGSSAKIG